MISDTDFLTSDPWHSLPIPLPLITEFCQVYLLRQSFTHLAFADHESAFNVFQLATMPASGATLTLPVIGSQSKYSLDWWKPDRADIFQVMTNFLASFTATCFLPSPHSHGSFWKIYPWLSSLCSSLTTLSVKIWFVSSMLMPSSYCKVQLIQSFAFDILSTSIPTSSCSHWHILALISMVPQAEKFETSL